MFQTGLFRSILMINPKMKHYLIAITLLFFLSSCAMPIVYSGYTLPQTNSVEVFYSAGEVHKDYKVMGRMVSHDYGKEIVKKEFEKYAKKIGADAVIIIGVDKSINGKPNRIVADAVKYN